jgi:hypothetical protein
MVLFLLGSLWLPIRLGHKQPDGPILVYSSRSIETLQEFFLARYVGVKFFGAQVPGDDAPVECWVIRGIQNCLLDLCHPSGHLLVAGASYFLA